MSFAISKARRTDRDRIGARRAGAMMLVVGLVATLGATVFVPSARAALSDFDVPDGVTVTEGGEDCHGVVPTTGTDIAPLLRGLHDDACQSPHWGYMISGELVVTYTDGTEETCAANALFYWPPGHSVRVTQNAEVVLFSPQQEHSEVIDHMLKQMAAT